MPFRGDRYRGTFNPEELQNMQEAFNLCCKQLKDENIDEGTRSALAKKIISAFEDGETDPEVVARLVAASVTSDVK